MAFKQTPPKASGDAKKDLENFTRYLEALHRHVNGDMSLNETVNGKSVTVTFRGIGEETPVEHGLGRVPSGFLVTDLKTPGAVISETGRSRTTNRIYLQSSVAGAKVTLLFH